MTLRPSDPPHPDPLPSGRGNHVADSPTTVCSSETKTRAPEPLGGLRIGPVALETPVLAAPIAGFTDLSFRAVVRQLGVLLGREKGSGLGLGHRGHAPLRLRDRPNNTVRLSLDAT